MSDEPVSARNAESSVFDGECGAIRIVIDFPDSRGSLVDMGAYRTILAALTEPAIEVSALGKISFANPAFCRLIGRKWDEIVDSDWRLFCSAVDDAGLSADLGLPTDQCAPSGRFVSVISGTGESTTWSLRVVDRCPGSSPQVFSVLMTPGGPCAGLSNAGRTMSSGPTGWRSS